MKLIYLLIFVGALFVLSWIVVSLLLKNINNLQNQEDNELND